MLPTEIGYAAAYEAYRIFLHHSERLYDVLYGRPDRQREALIATAVAEGPFRSFISASGFLRHSTHETSSFFSSEPLARHRSCL